MKKEEIKEILESNWRERVEDDVMTRFEYREMQKEILEHLQQDTPKESNSIQGFYEQIRIYLNKNLGNQALFSYKRLYGKDGVCKILTEYANQTKAKESNSVEGFENLKALVYLRDLNDFQKGMAASELENLLKQHANQSLPTDEEIGKIMKYVRPNLTVGAINILTSQYKEQIKLKTELK